jgi:NAD+ diphosphatase
MGYPNVVNLPFNGDIVKELFTPLPPGEPVLFGAGYWVILQGNMLVLVDAGGQLRLPGGDLPPWVESNGEPLCFGLWRGMPVRVAAIGRNQEIPAPFVAEPFNAITERIDDRLLTLGGIAQQILHWERLSSVCSRCGGALGRIPGSWGKKCEGCSHEHFPHIHPCAIVLVRRGEEFLLARKPEWPAGRYSLVAGFLDFGESLEECARREVLEETGIVIGAVHYVGSQCWPFPSQLMAGFVADYAGGEIVVDRNELEDARWFCVEDMPESLPSPRSIARWIIDTFALGKSLPARLPAANMG